MSKSILYLVPDLLGTPGGIARYSGLVCKALVQDGFLLQVLSRMDRQAQGHNPMAGLAMSYQSCNGSKIAFAWQAFWQTLVKHPAIILVGHPHFALLGWLLARISGARLVVFIYGMDVFKPLASSRRWALRRADEIISISQFTAQQAVRTNGIPPERVRVLHNCLDPQFEDGLGKPNTPNLSILTVGRLSPYEHYKGHDYVIRAMPALLAQFPNLVYDVVGDGAWRADLEQLATQAGVAHAVRFHGEVSEEMLRQHYAGADLFIMPSRAEGFGFVFLEAMAYGMPVIGGNLDATPEVVVDGVTGYLVNPTIVESIVEAASRLLKDEALRRKMGQAAAQHVKQNFGFDKFQQQLSTYLAELVPVQ